MNCSRVQAVISRELLEIRKNRMLIFTIFFPPLLLSLIPIVMFALIGGGQMADGKLNTSGEQIARYYALSPEFAKYSANELMQLIVFQQFMVLYLIMPLIIPMTVAAYSIIGEKEARSLEPLLATPIRTSELLWGKSLAAIVPAVIGTWIAYAIFFIGARFVTTSAVFAGLLNPTWIVATIVLTPLLALFAVGIGVMISSRVNDTRVAQQIGGMLVIPMVALGLAQTAGFILLNAFTFVVGAVVIALMDVGVLYSATRIFQREKILTQWK
jgi:ABC-2 type transport system permease protein